MQIKKKICGLLLAFGLINFIYGQQDSRSPECLNQTNEYKNSVFILIDPGHGCASNNGLACLPGGQPGAADDPNNVSYSEACMTTDLALRLRDMLQGLGLNIEMTRDTNIVQFPGRKAELIRERIREAKVNIGDSLKPYFISIHFNGGPADVHGNYGIYAHSNRTGESVANIVSNAQNTVYVNNQGQPVANTYPQVTLHDNQNNLFDALRENIQFVLGDTPFNNTILYNNSRNTTCPNQMRPSYKNIQIYKDGIFPLLSGWYASVYNQCTDQFSGPLVDFSDFLPNTESIPVNHSLQEVEFISSTSFLNYLNLRQFVAIAMAWAITEDVVNDYISGGGNASCMRGSMYNPDSPDDNKSSSSGISSGLTRIGSNSPILMPFEFINREIISLLNKIGVSPAVTFKEFSSSMVEEHLILIIPTGLLTQYENDSVFKIKLDQYVKNGGTVIVLAQQYGTHYEKVVPLPEGSSLSALGWREDQSCFWGSAYHKTLNNVPHPIFSGVGGESVSVGVDGYFSIVPTEATVLLRRKLNQEPVMISYPYGEGMVILTSLFSDFANAHSQMSGVDEAHIVRDLLTYARNVKREIPSWVLTRDQAMAISLPEVDVRNDSEVAVAKAKFRVLSPDRKRVLYSVEQGIAIEPQAIANAALEFSITPTGLYEDLVRNWIGIYHVEVELYDAAGSLIQPFSESDGGLIIKKMMNKAYETRSQNSILTIGCCFIRYVLLEKKGELLMS